MMTREDIAAVLKSARIRAGFTQQQAADGIGRKRQTLASWETGQSQPDANTLFELFDFYGQSADEAFGFNAKKKHATSEANDGLSDAERGLMELFRLLTPDQQDMVIEVVQAAAKRQKSQ